MRSLGLKHGLTREAADAIASTPRRRREARRELVGRRLMAGALAEKQERRWLDLGRRRRRQAERRKAEAEQAKRGDIAAAELVVRKPGLLGSFARAVRPHRHRAR